LFGISLISFGIMELAPGDFLNTIRANDAIPPELVDSMAKRFGLDQPWYVRYERWLENVVLHADFGESFSYRQPVISVMAPRLGNSLLLALAAALITWGLAIPLGIVAAVRQYSWWDKGASFGASFGLAIPEVFFALLLLLFSAKTGWFPIGGMHSLDYDDLSPLGKALDIGHHLVLPAVGGGPGPPGGPQRPSAPHL